MKEKEPKNAEAVIKDIRRRTKRKFSSEEKIRIVISGFHSAFMFGNAHEKADIKLSAGLH